jgi:protein-L-isoaspartate O-methyltransferase
VNALDLDWKPYADRFAASITEGGEPCSAELRKAFAAVARHVFVPRAYRQDDDGRWSPFDTVDDLDAVYSPEDLVTEVIEAVDRQTPVVSGTGPRLLVGLLETLGLREGHRVLEIGTGTGYATAVLAHRLGGERVFATEPGADAVEGVLARLGLAGFEPTVVVAERELGLAEHAPYDRILVSRAVPAVSWAWAGQLAPEGAILVPLDVGGADSHVLLRLEGDSLQGNFIGQHVAEPAGPPEDEVEPPIVKFLARLQLRRGTGMVRRAGSRWRTIGSPGWERFGLTVLPDGFHRVWLDDPDGDFRWTLPPDRSG